MRFNRRAILSSAIVFLVSGVMWSPLAAGSESANQPKPVDARTELSAAIAILKANDLNRDKVDWATLEKKAFELAHNAQTAPDAYPAIDYLIAQMADHHSFLQRAETARAVNGGAAVTSSTPGLQVNLPYAGRYPGDVLAIAVPGHMGPLESDQAYSSELQRIIRKGHDAGLCRILIDLRWNEGGNMWPMLEGLRELLGHPPFGYFAAPDGREAPWNSGMDDNGNSNQQAVIPIAILIGRNTTSSGEFIALAFKGLPNTRFFGEPTAGLVTSNGRYALPDGANLFVANSLVADRSHHVYRGSIPPDETTAIGQPTLDAGLQWLSKQECHVAK